MNKKLFGKVKDLCKDTGLSEKYLKAITEKMGGSVEDDSTDEAAIDEAANQIAEIAKETQGEATRWATKKNDPDKDPKPDSNKTDPAPGKASPEDDERLKALEKQIEELKGLKATEDRKAAVAAAQAKHQIPDWRMKGLVVPDDQDPNEFLASVKQDLITQGLMPADTEGAKAANDAALDEQANSLLESITVK